MESQNGGAAQSRRDTKREWTNNSATSRKARRKCSRPPVQAMWTRYTPGQTNQDANAYIGKLQTQLSEALERWRSGDDCIEEVHSFAIELDEARQRADEVQEDCVHGESQQLADAQERIRGLEEDLANADWVHEDYVYTESQRLADAQEQIQELEEDLANTVEGLREENNNV